MASTVDDYPILSILDPTGRELNYYIIARYSFNDVEYMALLSCDGFDNDIELFRCNVKENDQIEITEILSVEEFDAANEEYFRIISQPGASDSEDVFGTIYITDESGKEIECQILNMFSYGDRDFIALMPLSPDMVGDINIQLFGYSFSDIDNDNVGVTLMDIPEDEYEGIKEYFLQAVI